MADDPEATFDSSEQPAVMSEAETIAFLRESGVAPLDIQNWKPGQPVLYVFPERFRADDAILSRRRVDQNPLNLRSVPLHKRPTIARVDCPSELRRSLPSDEQVSFEDYVLVNEGGRIDYFVIDQKTKRPRIVRSTVGVDFVYDVRPKTLFAAADLLFPRGENL